MRYILLPFLVWLLMLSNVTAQQTSYTPNIEAENWLLKNLRYFSRIRAGKDMDKVRDEITLSFMKRDKDGGGISQQDHNITLQIQQARWRATIISRWAKNDLDGDGLVTRSEFTLMHTQSAPRMIRYGGSRVPATKKQREKLIQQNVEKAMKADLNEDDAVSIEETIASSDENSSRMNRFRYRSMERQKIPTSFDANEDGTITFNEFMLIADTVLKSIDTNHDGLFSANENRNYNQKRRRINRTIPRALPRL